MRQRLRKFFPIVLIALAVQILAPIASCWAAAMAATDPLGAIEICHSDPTATSGPTDQGTNHRDGACAICCLAQANATFDAPQSVVDAAPVLTSAAVVWRDSAPDYLASRSHTIAQARAPPQAT